ncbi:rCG22187 [Rattus norvegicus]|uniref:RCG22187 n=1 Tax=Rattus norvegicus TaxID=10116 RepID=A6INW3_RAT|nr:rCG22187 [Rattus norvegicus]
MESTLGLTTEVFKRLLTLTKSSLKLHLLSEEGLPFGHPLIYSLFPISGGLRLRLNSAGVLRSPQIPPDAVTPLKIL